LLVSSRNWRGLSVIQKTEILLRVYIRNLELHFFRSGFNKGYEMKLREARTQLERLKGERIA
jgi:hypothetical protein